MNSFPSKKKDSTFFDKVLSTAPKSTQQNKRYAIKLLGKFVEESYPERNLLDVIEELRLLKSQDSQTYEDALSMGCFKNRLIGIKRKDEEIIQFELLFQIFENISFTWELKHLSKTSKNI